MTDSDAMTALAIRAAEQLQGSSQGLANLGEEYEAAEFDSVFCAVLDSLVFNCEQCGWWFEQSEMAEDCGDEWICEECNKEQET